MSIELIGDKQLFKALLELTNDSAIRVMRPSISKALTPVRKQAKLNVKRNRRSGALQRAISKKAGGKRGSKKAWGKVYVNSKPQEFNGKNINPVKYAHFIEFGTRNSRPYPFLRLAMAQSRSQVSYILQKEAAIKLNQFAGRLRKKYHTRRPRR